MSRRKDTPVCTFLRQDGRPTGSRQRLAAEPSCSYVSRPDRLPTSDDLCPWETRAPSEGGGQLASSSARTMPPTGSSLSCSSLHRSSRVSLASTSSVARIDSHASLRSLGYELAQIPSTFAHSTATSVDLASEAIESYRQLHTYPMLEKRVRKDAGFGAGSLCTSCALMAGPTRPVSVDHIKPKLLVFGETAPLIYSYARPAPSRTKQPLKPTKAENPHLNTASVHSLSRCHPASSDHTPLTQCHPVSSDYTPHPVPSDTPPPSSSTSLIREIWEDRLEREAKGGGGGGGGRGGRGRGGGRGRKGGGGEEGETTFRSRSFDGQSFPSGHDQLSVAAVMATTPRSDPVGEPERAGHKNRTLDGSVKWTSLTFPSFAVCSLSNTAPGKPSMAGRGRGGRTRKKDGGGHGHHAPSLPNHHSRSMPFISPKTSSANFDSLLLRRQSMVAFRGGLQPGFRYETLCLQDNDTVTSSTGPAVSDPLTIAGPWITTH